VKKIRRFNQEVPEKAAESFEDIARMMECHVPKKYRANTRKARNADNHLAARKASANLLDEFSRNSLSGIYLKLYQSMIGLDLPKVCSTRAQSWFPNSLIE